MQKIWIISMIAALALCFVAGVLVSSSGMSPEQPADASEPLQERPSPLAALIAAPEPEPPLSLDLTQMTLEGDRYTVPLPDGRRAVLSLDPRLQQPMQALFDRHELPHAAFVAVEPATGRVLALVSHESAPERLGQVALRATAPSASIFKTITAAALIEDEHLTPTTRRCYAWARSTPTDEAINGQAPNDGCTDLGTAFGLSNNSVFSGLAYERLDQITLQSWAARFGYNEDIPFPVPLDPSRADIPSDPLERARTAAGFWNSTLSPLHGALISASVANGGVMMRPLLIDHIEDAQGAIITRFHPQPLKRVMQPEHARTLAALMVYTTQNGTAREQFRDSRDWPQGVIAAGKTGTLSQKQGDLTYNWFVGFSSIDNPQIAVATLLYNPPKWRIKATFAAAHGLTLWHNANRPKAKDAPKDLAAADPKDDPKDDPKEKPEGVAKSLKEKKKKQK
jgi:peptidoglycan glycosyltransferase